LGFNRRKLEDQRREAANKEAAKRAISVGAEPESEPRRQN
jgi:hypothetical protein